jgi:two-component system phosphate regulon sensor histidine kinase PhoR
MDDGTLLQPAPPDLPAERGDADSVNDQLVMAKLVFEITRRFASSLDLNEVLAEVLSLTVDSLGADHGSIFLFDQDEQVSQHILARRHLPAEESKQAVSAVMDKGLAGWAVRHRQVALVEDTRTDPRWHHLPGDELSTRSAMAVPLLHRGQLNGLLTLMHSEPNTFTQEHLDLVSAIAGQAATAVENARLFTHVREERAVLQALINGVREPIIVTDAQSRVRYTNPAARALDEALEQAVGQPVEATIPSERLNRLFRRLLDSGQPQRDEISWPDGRIFDANLVLVPGVGSVAVLHDVTHFKELDRMKSDFVAAVSHDLKSPLTVIYGYVELLQNALPDLNELVRQSLEEIRLSATRMQNLVVTLLDLAQIESGLDQAAEPCQMSETILDVLNGYRLQAQEKNIALHIVVADDLPMIMGQPVRLGQAVSNLVGNAIKYTPPGGKVTVLAQVSAHKLVVQVNDTGPGISSAKQTGLFGKFYKVSARETRDQEGHGLGLAIVKSVVEAHGGRVWVESKVGEGSTFAFSLPVVEIGEDVDPFITVQDSYD